MFVFVFTFNSHHSLYRTVRAIRLNSRIQLKDDFSNGTRNETNDTITPIVNFTLRRSANHRRNTFVQSVLATSRLGTELIISLLPIVFVNYFSLTFFTKKNRK